MALTSKTKLGAAALVAVLVAGAAVYSPWVDPPPPERPPTPAVGEPVPARSSSDHASTRAATTRPARALAVPKLQPEPASPAPPTVYGPARPAPLDELPEHFRAVVTQLEADRQWRFDEPVYFDVTLRDDGRELELHLTEDGRITKRRWK